MAITIRSVLQVGKLLAPVIGGAIRLVGGKKKTAAVVEKSLKTHPRTVTAGVTFAVIVILRLVFPEQANEVIAWLQVNLPEILEALKAASATG